MLSTRGLGLNAEKRLYEGVIVAMALIVAENRGSRSVEVHK